VKEARLEQESVVGSFGETEWSLSDPVVLCVDFANCRTDLQIVSFTKKYGPVCGLDSNWRGSRCGQPFQFSISEWRQVQYDYRKHWEMLAQHSVNPAAEAYYGGMSQGDHWRGSRSGWRFIFSDLRRLLTFWLMALPPERRRVCGAPKGDEKCGMFFFAEKLTQHYCSDGCADRARARVKLEHWNRNKATYLKKRKQAVEKKKHTKGEKKK